MALRRFYISENTTGAFLPLLDLTLSPARGSRLSSPDSCTDASCFSHSTQTKEEVEPRPENRHQPLWRRFRFRHRFARFESPLNTFFLHCSSTGNSCGGDRGGGREGADTGVDGAWSGGVRRL